MHPVLFMPLSAEDLKALLARYKSACLVTLNADGGGERVLTRCLVISAEGGDVMVHV